MAAKTEITELTIAGDRSVEDQLRDLSPQELLEQIRSLNGQLGELGVKVSVLHILSGASCYLYEDKRESSGGVKPTAMNCFMSLIHQQPGLKTLSQEEFEKLGQIVSHISLATDELLNKRGGSVNWHQDLLKSPPTKTTTL